MKTSISKLILLMLALGCAHVSSAQAPKPGLKAARYRPVAQGEPAPYTGILLDKPTYDMETAKFDALAALIASQKIVIGKMAEDTVKYSQRLREEAKKLAAQRELTTSAQAALTTTQASLKVTQQAAEILKPKWYERPLTFGPICFLAGAAGGGYLIYKVVSK